MKRNSTVTHRNRHDEKCKHAAHARRNDEHECCGYHDHQKAHDCTCPRCGRSTRPNMFVCPHCGMHIAMPTQSAAKRAAQAEVRMSRPLRLFAKSATRKVATQPAPQKRQRYMSEEMATQLAATIPAVA